MDIPPPQNYTNVSQVRIIDYDSTGEDEHEVIFFLLPVDSSDIPQNVKQFARDNDCRYLEKKYYWSEKLFQNKGGVYRCATKEKSQYIIDNTKKLRFAKWWEKHKFKHNIFLQ